MSDNTPEPMPVRTTEESIWDMVIADMRERDHVGSAKYGGTLTAHDGRKSLVDAYQEALDLAVYLKKKIVEERQPIADLWNVIDMLYAHQANTAQFLEEEDEAIVFDIVQRNPRPTVSGFNESQIPKR